MYSASCTAALSFIFKPCPHDDLVKAGSIGVGCTIDRIVKVTIQPDDHSIILFNGSQIDFPTVEYVVRQLTNQPITVSITSSLPLGCGFGISGASALATAYALNQLVETQDIASLRQIAHTAEIVHKTGLGTVATQITGGFLIKHAPGLPIIADRLPFAGQPLYLTILDKLETPEILSDVGLMKKVRHAADRALQAVHRLPQPTLSQVIDISYIFIRESNLPMSRQTKEFIESIRNAGGSATMAILGQTVISTQPPPSNHGYQVEKIRITTHSVA